VTSMHSPAIALVVALYACGACLTAQIVFDGDERRRAGAPFRVHIALAVLIAALFWPALAAFAILMMEEDRRTIDSWLEAIRQTTARRADFDATLLDDERACLDALRSVAARQVAEHAQREESFYETERDRVAAAIESYRRETDRAIFRAKVRRAPPPAP